jgi:hypothetical protein
MELCEAKNENDPSEIYLNFSKDRQGYEVLPADIKLPLHLP